MRRKYDLRKAALHDVVRLGGNTGNVVYRTAMNVVIDWRGGPVISYKVTDTCSFSQKALAKLGNTWLFQRDVVYSPTELIIVNKVEDRLCFNSGTFAVLRDGIYLDTKYFSVNPKAPTIRVHGIEVPAPLQEAPVVGTIVYYPSIASKLKYGSTVFSGTAWHKNMFARKVLWETPEGAIAYVGALTGM